MSLRITKDSSNDTVTASSGLIIPSYANVDAAPVAPAASISYNAATGGVFVSNGSAWNPVDAGSGNVTGPNTSTDNALAIYNGVTGKTVKNSTATLVAGVLTTSSIKLATTGGAPSTLDYFEVVNFPLSFGGPYDPPGVSVTIVLQRIGRVVTAFIPTVIGTYQSAMFLLGDTVLPARFLPVSPVVSSFPTIIVTNGTVNSVGSIQIGAGGVIQIWAGVDGTTSQFAGVAGVTQVGMPNDTCISWMTA